MQMQILSTAIKLFESLHKPYLAYPRSKHLFVSGMLIGLIFETSYTINCERNTPCAGYKIFLINKKTEDILHDLSVKIFPLQIIVNFTNIRF